MQHCADSLLFPSIAFLHSTLNLLADRAKGYTVSRRIPFEPPLIKLKSRKRSLLINLFNRGNRGYRSSKRLFPSFASITTICKTQRSGRKKKDQMENKKKEEETGCKKRRKRRKTAKEGEEGAGKKWKSACFEVLSTKLEFQKGQVKFSIPSIPSSRPQPSCDPPRLLISFSTLFRPTVSPLPTYSYVPPIFLLPMPPPFFLLCFFNIIDEAIRPSGSSLFIVYQPV